ncbi:MAG: nucleotide-binding protein [Rhodospirillales bacterium]|nr:nucleotide-binding protein [Rhodospirillales bacterium]
MNEVKKTEQEARPRSKLSQADVPIVTLDQALRIADAIWDNFAGKGAAPFEIAMAANLSPTSGPWRSLCGASIAYGLTEGGYNAQEIRLTDLGRRIVAPTVEGDDIVAKKEAILKPRVLAEFFGKYDRAKFPKDDIAKNVLVGLGVPKERAEKAFTILKANGDAVGIIVETKTGPFVALDSTKHAGAPAPDASNVVDLGGGDESEYGDVPEVPETPEASAEAEQPHNNRRVFITHGKNKKILDQVKEIVRYGQFEPVVAQEHESTSKPVPEKVMSDMRRCGAAVIHVGAEGVLADEEGKLHPQINGNVLIEIGAAMALYQSNFILLVEEGVNLPSNLQGLYECRYSGDSLDGESTMKLLKAFNEFK